MVLNNPSPYTNEDDDDDDELEMWEFVDHNLTASEEAHAETSSNDDDDDNAAPASDLQLDESQSNSEEEGADDGDDKCSDDEHETNKSVSAGKQNSDVYECDDDRKEITTPVDTNNEKTDSWTPLNTEEIPHRPESPDQTLPLPLHETWHFITSSLRDIEQQNQLRQRAQTGARKLNTSAQNLWSNLSNETQRLATTLQKRCDQADVQAREASLSVKRSVSTTKDNLCRLNSEYKIHEKVAAVAAVGGAVLLAAGNPRAGAGTLLVAGGALAAGEAMSASSERGCSTFTRDFGLREGVHLD